MSIFEMNIEALLRDIDFTIGKPFIEVQVIDPESGLGEGVPVDILGLFSPVSDWVLECAAEGCLIGDCKFGNAANHGII